MFKERKKKRISSFLCAIATVGAGVFPALGAAAPVTTLPAGGIERVEIGTISGDIIAAGWDRQQIEISTDGEGLPGIKVNEGTLRIGRGVSFRSASSSLKIFVPRGLKLSFESISGDIGVGGVKGRIDISTTSGDILVQACSGPLDAHTVSGDVALKGASGEIAVESVSGDLLIDASGAPGLELKTISGKMTLRKIEATRARLSSHSGDISFVGSIAAAGSFEAKTWSGEIHVELPAAAGFEVKAHSASGDVRVQHKLAAWELDEHSVAGRAGGGGPEVRLNSSSGDIDVRISR